MSEAAPIDARVIAMDETEWYVLKPEHAKYVSKVYGVYLYDKNSHTHICSMTPSYWLIHLYNIVVLSAEGERLGQDARDAVKEAYEYEQTEDDYFDCGRIDALEKALEGDRSRYHVYGPPKVAFSDLSREQHMEAIREDLCGNPPL